MKSKNKNHQLINKIQKFDLNSFNDEYFKTIFSSMILQHQK